MRFSSLVSLLVVTASFALGGCAADAEQTSSEVSGQGASALIGTARAQQLIDDKTAHAAAFGEEAARTRVFDTKVNQAVANGRTSKVVELGASAGLTQTADMINENAAGLDKAGRANVIDGLAANPAQLIEEEGEHGAHLPSSQQLSRSGEAHEETSTSNAKIDP